MTTQPHAAAWKDAFPDPAERAAWIAAFTTENLSGAERQRPYFTDPQVAKDWYTTFIPAPTAAYMHRHGVDQGGEPLSTALDAVRAGGRTWEEVCRHAAITLAHPDLPAAEQRALARAGIALDEVDDLLATGTYDRDAIALMAGLT